MRVKATIASFILVLGLAGVATYSQLTTSPGGVKATNTLAPTAGAQMAAVGGIVSNVSGLITQVTAGTMYCSGGTETIATSRFTHLANTSYLLVANCNTHRVYAKTGVTGPGSATGQPGVPNTLLQAIPGVEVPIASIVCGASTCATITDARVPSQWATGSTFGGTGAAVASAATTVLTTNNVQHVTGTTNITTLNTCDSTTSGQKVVLIFDGVLTFTDGNNLKLAGNLTTTADDTISLVCDGTNWYETARSVN